MLKFTVNIVTLVISTSVWAQKADTIKRNFTPTGIRFGVDAFGAIQSRVDENFKGYEVSADMDFYRYYLTVDAGRWEKSFSEVTEQYRNSGNYVRVGIDVNFLKKDPDRNMFFIGARYGHGTFSETLTKTTDDAVWGPVTENFSNTNSRASWFEITSGIRVKMYKFFWMGYTIRYKAGLATRGVDELEPFDVPGYGTTFKSNTWGFNYLLLVRMPIKKQQ